MKIEMKKWEVERIKEIVGDILDFWMYDLIEMESSSSSHKMGMSVETFLENLERKLTE